MGEFADFFYMGICLTKMPLAAGLWRSRCQGGASHHAGLFALGWARCSMRWVLWESWRCITGTVVKKHLSGRCPDDLVGQLSKKGLP